MMGRMKHGVSMKRYREIVPLYSGNKNCPTQEIGFTKSVECALIVDMGSWKQNGSQ